jgi:hypothetical protein
MRENVNFKAVHYQNSFDNWKIQYADYIAGLYNSYGKIMLNVEAERWLYNEEIYKNFHSKYVCLKCQLHSIKKDNPFCDKTISYFIKDKEILTNIFEYDYIEDSKNISNT